jgi:hypothetical protein
MTVHSITNKLVDGDPLDPSDFDIIMQEGRLDVGVPVPDGWKVITGNQLNSQVIRLMTRWEIDQEEVDA